MPLDPAWPTTIATLDDLEETLNVEAGDDAGELQATLDAATNVIEFLCGPVVAQARTEFHDGGVDTIYLGRRPVLAVDSVTEYTPTAQALAAEPYGTATYTSYGYRLDTDKGTLLRTAAGSPSCFRAGSGNVKVVYYAGRATVPEPIRAAVRELVRTAWQPQQSGNLPGIDVDNEPRSVVLGYYVPYRVLEMVQPYRQMTAC